MRASSRLATLLLSVALISPSLGDAARKSKRKSKDDTAAAAPAAVIVRVTDKTVLRAEPSEIGKPLPKGKVRPKDKLTFVERSPDGKWAQVRKGKVAGWVAVGELEGLPPEAVAQAPTPPPDPEPVLEPVKETKPQAPPKPVEPPKPVAEPPKPADPPVVAQVPQPGADVEAVRDKQAPEDKDTKAKAQPKASSWIGPLYGPWASVGGGVALLNSSFDSRFKSGLDPEFFKYSLDFLPAVGAQARIGYTFGWKWLRIGADVGYRFAGGAEIVVRLPDKDPLPPGTATLRGSRQTLSLTAHDADGGLSVGAYFGLGSKLEMSIRARGALQLQAFLPDFNPNAVLPKELFYGPLVGGVIEFQTRSAPGFGLRLEGGYIPLGVRQQNDNARDAVCFNAKPGSACLDKPDSSSGFSVGASLAFRVVSGLDIELGYRLLSTRTEYAEGSVSERLRFDRDDEIKRRADFKNPTVETLDFANRATMQQMIFIGAAFRR